MKQKIVDFGRNFRQTLQSLHLAVASTFLEKSISKGLSINNFKIREMKTLLLGES